MSQRKTMKCWVRGHARFHDNKNNKQWTSDLAWAEVVYIRNKDKLVFLQVCGQKPKGVNSVNWCKPYFDEKAQEKMKDHCLTLMDKPNRGQRTTEERPPLRGHEESLCQRCTSLGRPCWQRK